jgi:YcaO-like protein with predicted kinase domain
MPERTAGGADAPPTGDVVEPDVDGGRRQGHPTGDGHVDGAGPDGGAAGLSDAVTVWLGDPGAKATRGAQHAGEAATTLTRVLPLARRLGLTRVADITGLDHVGIPVAAAYRPNARSLAVSGGKGVSPDAARASAVMEAVETAHGERPDLALRLASVAELRAHGTAVVHPTDLPRRPGPRPDDHADLLWVEGVDLGTGATAWVPHDAVHLDLTRPPGGHDGGARPTSNGLASGVTLAEALAHALCELVERDAAALWDAAGPAHQAGTRIDPAGIDDPATCRLIERCLAAGLDIALYDLTSDIGIPVVACHLAERDPDPFRPLPAAGGVGCHPHPSTAAVRAVTEAAQSRLIDIAGARDDLFRADHAARVDPEGPFAGRLPPLPSAPRTLPGGPGDATDSMAGDVALLVARLAAAGIAPVAVDLTRDDIGIPVVRAVAAGLEGPPAAMAGAGIAPGPRARAATAAGTVPAPASAAAGTVPAATTGTDPATPAMPRVPVAAATAGPTAVDPTTSPTATAAVAGGEGARERAAPAGRPVVFAGPTIPADAVTSRLDAEVRPPAAQGDVARAAAGRPAAIVLVDGVYQGVPAVWHKEVLWALAQGVPVYGAASMGALRAAELADFGMVGVGAVFEGLRAGRLLADDEVAVAHAGPEDGYTARSVALVDIRATLDAAVIAGIVTATDAATAIEAAQALFYPERVWPVVLAAARRAGLPAAAAETLRCWVGDHAVSWKRADAEAVLDRVHHDLASDPAVPAAAPGAWALARTDQWRRVEAELDVAREAEAPGDELLDELRLDDAYFPAHQACLLTALARRLAPGIERVSTDAGDGAAREGLRRGLGLADDQALADWALAQGITPERLVELARDQEAVEWAHGWGHDEALRRIGDHLRLRGRYAPVAERATRRRRSLATAGLPADGPLPALVAEDDLWSWLARRHPATAHAAADREAHARRLGFADAAAFRRAGLRAHLADTAPAAHSVADADISPAGHPDAAPDTTTRADFGAGTRAEGS